MSLSSELQARKDAVLERTDLVSLIQRHVALKRAGRDLAGICPFHEESTASFTVVPDKGFFHCFGCQANGDAIAFVQRWEGCGFIDALARLEGDAGLAEASSVAKRARKRDDRPSVRVPTIDCAQWIWRTAVPIAGELAEAYLQWRGCDPAPAIGALRFHPRCPVFPWRTYERPEACMFTAPAMVGLIVRVEGPPGARRTVPMGVHTTFLRDDGRGKARFAPMRNGGTIPARKMWGGSAGGAVLLRGGPVATDGLFLDGEGPLVVAEGIESTLSLMEQHRAARGACATLSLGNLQGQPMIDGPGGSLPIWNLRPDPARAPFVIADAGPVLIGVDADMKRLTNRRVQDGPRAPYVVRDISGAERATICAHLASMAWKRAGARGVTAVRPPAGMDFNDVGRAA